MGQHVNNIVDTPPLTYDTPLYGIPVEAEDTEGTEDISTETSMETPIYQLM